MLKTLVLFVSSFLLLASVHAAPGSPILISGFDDVIRQAENHSLWRAALKLLEKDRTFTGMPELYSGLSREVPGDVKFSLISGTSSLFESRILEMLREEKFPSANLYLRNWLTEWSVEKFKITSLRKVIGGDSNQKFIVIFDNSGPSIEMARSIPEAFPGQVLAVYLHEIVQHAPVSGATLYITAYDIALAEWKAGRMKEESLQVVAQAILGVKDSSRIIPGYAYCPVSYDPCGVIENIHVRAQCAEIRGKVSEVCLAR